MSIILVLTTALLKKKKFADVIKITAISILTTALLKKKNFTDVIKINFAECDEFETLRLISTRSWHINDDLRLFIERHLRNHSCLGIALSLRKLLVCFAVDHMQQFLEYSKLHRNHYSWESAAPQFFCNQHQF